MEGPCKDCKYSGCGIYHDSCEKYQAYKVEWEKLKVVMENDRKNHTRIRRDRWKIGVLK